MIPQDKKQLERCYGCYACINACPEKCISMVESSEGFNYPKINMELCLNCGLCEKSCPIGRRSEEVRDEPINDPCFYKCYSLENTVRKRSASGGFAYTISEYIISKGGVVFGVIGKWFGHVHHTKAETIDELTPMCNSKNIQSDVGETYQQAKEELKNGRTVLFTGTPCQIAGLYTFLGKEYENLFTCDLICHGVPSQKILKSYICELEKRHKSKISSFGRDNANRYIPVEYIARFENGDTEILMPKDSAYRMGFLRNLFQRKSCYNCEYSRIPRVGDFTIGDWFNQDDLKIIDKDNIGVSLVSANNLKAKYMIKELSDKLYINEISIKNAKENNLYLYRSPTCSRKIRRLFFRLYPLIGVSVTMRGIIMPIYSVMSRIFRVVGKFEKRT